MKAKFPIIGLVRTGKDAENETTVVTREVDSKDKALNVFGGLVEFSTTALSGEKSISSKIMLANRGWVYRNNDAIAQEVSKIDFQLFTVGLSEGEIVFNEVNSHPLLDLLDKPNDETTKLDYVYTTQSHKKLAGDAFTLKVRANGRVVGLRELQPDKIVLNLRTPTADDPTVILSYDYKDVINGEKINISYDPKDIIHFKKPNPNNQFRGLGAVEAMADAIDLDNLTTETAKKFFTNGAISNFVLTTESKVTDEQLRRLKAEMKATYGGVSNAYKAMILGGGLKPSDISYSNKDMQFLDQLEWYRDKIMYGFGNTKASLGMIDDVNRASHQGSITEWLRNTVKPDMEAIVNTLNEFLVPEFGDNLVLGFADPVPQDKTNDIAEVQALYPIGIMTLNEARDLADLDQIEEGGDEFYSAPTPTILEQPEDEEGEDENEE